MMRVVKGLVTGGNGDNWLASTQGLPDGKQAMALAKSWKQLQQMIQDATERTLGLPPGSVVVDMEFEDPELQELVNEVRRSRGVLRDARFEAGAAMGKAARTLTKTATVRDVAQMLGCSHQQVAKLAPKSSA